MSSLLFASTPFSPKSQQYFLGKLNGATVAAGTLFIAPGVSLITRRNKMNNDRIEGIVKQAKGSAKDAAGKLLGDAKLQAEGKQEKLSGKVQNAIGGLKDAAKKGDKS
jgi:uncharacterized protein YjbJ (UPF0337 family)